MLSGWDLQSSTVPILPQYCFGYIITFPPDLREVYLPCGHWHFSGYPGAAPWCDEPKCMYSHNNVYTNITDSLNLKHHLLILFPGKLLIQSFMKYVQDMCLYYM